MTAKLASVRLYVFVMLGLSAPVLTVPPTVAHAQAAVTAVGALEREPWWTLWSWQSPHDRILAGAFTTHFNYLWAAPKNSHAIGLICNGVLGGTFVTTYGRRAWVVAFERAWLEGSWGPTRTMLGFRAGLLYGYDESLFAMAGILPIIPYGQPLALIRWGPATLDVTSRSWSCQRPRRSRYGRRSSAPHCPCGKGAVAAFDGGFRRVDGVAQTGSDAAQGRNPRADAREDSSDALGIR